MQGQCGDRNPVEDKGERRNLDHGDASEEEGSSPEKTKKHELSPVAFRHRTCQRCRAQRFTYSIRQGECVKHSTYLYRTHVTEFDLKIPKTMKYIYIIFRIGRISIY